VIGPLTPADDFARQLSFDELAALATATIAEQGGVVCSLGPNGIGAVRRELGETRTEALMRELNLFVRRNLRGSDAVAMVGDELVLLLGAATPLAETVGQRLLSASRGHVFSGGASDRSLRLTLSLGIAASPVDGQQFDELLAAARRARQSAGEDALASASARRSGALELARFVGRSEELSRLTDYLEDMVRGVGRVVAVIGETGVGTSALVRSLEPEVRMRGGSLVVAAAREGTLAAPYAVWSDVLRGVRRLPVKSTRGWRELPSLDGSLERPVNDPPRGRSKIRLLEELADFLRLAAQQRPLVIHLEELQWADGASWDALEYLIPQLENERILIALSFRTREEDDDAAERWRRLASRPRHHEIRLTRLTRDDVKRWLEGSMRGEEVGRDLLTYVYRTTEGNPLLVGHLLRDLEESGHLVREGRQWRWSAPADLPPQATLHELLGRRVERLPRTARQVLEAAAVLARDCDEGLVAEMTDLPAEAVAEGLSRLAAADLLVPTFERVKGMLAFAHEEIARAARRLLGEEQRVALHLRAAGVLSSRRGVSPTEIATHYDAAGASVEAHEHALLAADAALALYETGAAAELLASAERTAPSAEALANVRVRMASLAEVAGRYEEAEALCELALSWYEEQGDRLQALRVKRTRMLVRMTRGQSAQDTLEGLHALEQEAREVNADPERAAILLLISQTHWRLGDPVAAKRVAEECVEIAERVGDPALLCDSCNRLAITVQLEDAAHARALFNRSLVLATDIGDVVRRVGRLNNLGILELIENNWDEARAVLRAAVDEARTAGLTEFWGRASLNSGVLAARVGEYDAAAEYLGDALQLCANVQNSELQLYATYNLAHLERDRGRIREAGETYELVMALAQRIGQAEVEYGARAGFGLCELSNGAVESARRAAAQVEPFLGSRTDWFQGRELGEALILRLALLDGQPEQAVERLSRALALAAPSDVYGAASLTAELGEEMRAYAPELVTEALTRYGRRPEVLANPRIRDRFTVLLFDSKSTIDRTGRGR
jgi:tetratricopeptide (TPR) repeat protein/GGDEF domain-containing protein